MIPLWCSRILEASTWSPWLAMCKGASPFFVFAEMGAPLWTIISTTFSWPDRAAQWSGVKPSRVLDSRFAPLSNKRATMLAFPHFAATCIGVMLCWNINIKVQIRNIAKFFLTPNYKCFPCFYYAIIAILHGIETLYNPIWSHPTQIWAPSNLLGAITSVNFHDIVQRYVVITAHPQRK